MSVKKVSNKNTKDRLERKVNNLSEYKNLPKSISKYLEYVKKWLSEIIDFSVFESIDEKSAFDILYLIWIGQSFIKDNWTTDSTVIDANNTVYNNIQSWFLKEWYAPEMAKKCTDIIIKYMNDKSIIDLLLNEKSVLLLWQRWYLDNMDKIYSKFFDNKEDLIENWINSTPKWNEWCYIVAYQYNKEVSDRISNISHRIWEFIKKKKEEWLIDKSFDFIEYTNNNIHTSLLTTPTIQDFNQNMDDLENINNIFNGIKIIPYKSSTGKIKINRNSIIITTHPKDATFLENIKLALSNKPKDLDLWWARWSHITIWRFLWEIKNKKVLEELYEMIDGCSKDLPSEISPEKIVVWYINMETKYNEWSYFKIFPKYSVCFEED